MKLKYLFAALVPIICLGTQAQAQQDTNDAAPRQQAYMTGDGIRTNQNLQYEKAEPTEHYRANELSLDAFGTAAIGEYTVEHLANQSLNSVRQNTQFGVGAGLNYFITRYIGIGAEAYSHNTTGIFIDSASANLLLRAPLGGSGIAPYIMGGGGHQFDDSKYWFGQAGGGLEYRFLKHLGVFVDARVVWPNETKAYGVGRAGVNFSF
jgi:Outer membrane protein beta-barrel domain